MLWKKDITAPYRRTLSKGRRFHRSMMPVLGIAIVLAMIIVPTIVWYIRGTAHAQATPVFTQFPLSNANESLYGEASGPDGNVWFTTYLGAQQKAYIGKVTPNGAITEYFVGSSGGLTDGHEVPYDITPGPNNSLWFDTSGCYEVGNISTSGTVTFFPVSTDGTVALCPNTNMAYGQLSSAITSDANGDLWFVTTTGHIGHMTADGTVTTFAVPNPVAADGPSSIQHITVGKDGTIWFAQDAHNDNPNVPGEAYSIDSMTPTGVVTRYTVGPEYYTCLPNSISPGANGTMWFTGCGSDANGNNYVDSITPTGTIDTFTMPATSSGDAIIPDGGTMMQARDGNLWFMASDSQGNTYLTRLTNAGVFTTFPYANAPIMTSLGATDASGNLWLPTISPSNVLVRVAPVPFNLFKPLPPSSTQAYQQAHSQSASSHNSASAAEPVNMVGGNFLATRNEFSIPDHDLAVAFSLSYNSNNASQNSPVGFGWTHSYRMAIVPEASGSLIVYNEDGRMDEYTPDGQGGYTAPTDIHDTLTKTSSGYQVTRSDHTVYAFSADGLLTSITSPNNNQETLSYDAAGDLTTLTNSANRAYAFAYDTDGHLTRITDPLGRSYAYNYDASGNLISATDPNDDITAYAYDNTHHLLSITDARGVLSVVNTYDASGRVSTQQDALGNTTKFAYSTGQTALTDPRNNTTTYTYDARERLTRITDANGGITSYGYDTNDNQNAITDPMGHTTNFVYDASGNITEQTDANGNATQYTYDAADHLLSQTDPLGHTTSYAYDASGNLLLQTNAAGSKTSYTYDAVGDMISMTDPLKAVTKFTYDAQGNDLSITDPLGHTTHRTYDAASRVLSATNAAGYVTSYTYDALNHMIKTVDPLGDAVTVTYDADGNKTAATDADGHKTVYTYDAAGRLAKVTDALGHITTYAYDANGNMLSMMNANSHATTYAYDVLNRLITTINPLKQATHQSYDADGNQISSTDAKGQVTTYAYDAVHKLLSTTHADHSVVSNVYDADGNRTQMTDVTGKTTYTYNALDDITGVLSPSKQQILYGYDLNRHQAAITYPDGQKETYTYDTAGELTGATWGGKTTTYAYTSVGGINTVTNPNGAKMSYTYDKAGRLTNIVNTPKSGSGASYAYTLDAAGNRLTMTTAKPPTTGSQITKYGYDALNRLTSAQAPTATQSYTYDAVGNRLTQTTGTQTIKYTYDAADELLTAGTTLYGYDANGSRLKQTVGSQVTTYAYNAANRLTSVTKGTQSLGQYTYDGNGNRIKTTIGNASTSTMWNVNTALPLPLTQTTGTQTTDYQYGNNTLIGSVTGTTPQFEAYDGLGSIIGQTNSSGVFTNATTYNAYGSITAGTAPTSTQGSFGFTGQQQDSTGLLYLRARYYDPSTGTFLTRDTFPADKTMPMTLNRYVYTKDNPISFVDPSGNWAFNIHLGGDFGAPGWFVEGSVGLSFVSNGDIALTWTTGGGVSSGLEAGEHIGFSLSPSPKSSCDLGGHEAFVGTSIGEGIQVSPEYSTGSPEDSTFSADVGIGGSYTPPVEPLAVHGGVAYTGVRNLFTLPF